MKEFYSRIDRSQELAFHVAEFQLDVLKTFQVERLNTLVDFAIELEASKGIAIVHLSVEVVYGDEFSAMSHNCIVEFLIANIHELLDDDGLLSKEIWLELISEAYSLVRGMIAVRTLGFGIHDFPLPFLAHAKISERVEELLAAKRKVE